MENIATVCLYPVIHNVELRTIEDKGEFCLSRTF